MSNATPTTPAAPAILRAWKVRTSAAGVELTINGTTYELGPTAINVAFELERAAGGWNAPSTEHEVSR